MNHLVKAWHAVAFEIVRLELAVWDSQWFHRRKSYMIASMRQFSMVVCSL